MEKVKLSNGSIYELVSDGLQENSDKNNLTIIALLGERTLSEVDSETDTPDNVATITVLDSSDDECDIKKGYVYQLGCKKQKNYIVGREAVDTGATDENGNAIMDYQEVTDTVVIIELSKKDIREELDETKAKIDELNEIVDMLLVTSLEV